MYISTAKYKIFSPSTINSGGCSANSHISSTDSSKCLCNTGYQTNLAKNGCVVIPAKTNEQICKDSYGLNSSWDGTKSIDGKINCNCAVGYAWNVKKTGCVLPPAVPAKTNEQICKDNYGLYAEWAGTKTDDGN